MRAAFYTEFRGPISIETLPDPMPEADGVVVEVGATGLCRSDWHGWMGHDPDIVLPHVPGHELAGTIVAGCTNDYVGYLYTDSALSEGGYEPRSGPSDNIEGPMIAAATEAMRTAMA